MFIFVRMLFKFNLILLGTVLSILVDFYAGPILAIILVIVFKSII